jgi:hypothetical protein
MAVWLRIRQAMAVTERYLEPARGPLLIFS